jgi:K+-dependent Na+/Ca+ exchanger-like protein
MRTGLQTRRGKGVRAAIARGGGTSSNVTPVRQSSLIPRRSRRAQLPVLVTIAVLLTLALVALMVTGHVPAPAPAVSAAPGARRLLSAGTEPTCDNVFDEIKPLAIVVYLLVEVVVFWGIAIVCDDYFMAGLEEITERLKLSPSVAGASVLAAGSSAPEFFTSLVGVLFYTGSVGVSTIIGSAAFNLLCITAVTGLCAGQVLYLDWRPFARDATFYACSIALMAALFRDGAINWYDSLILTAAYTTYLIYMVFNDRITARFCGGGGVRGEDGQLVGAAGKDGDNVELAELGGGGTAVVPFSGIGLQQQQQHPGKSMVMERRLKKKRADGAPVTFRAAVLAVIFSHRLRGYDAVRGDALLEEIKLDNAAAGPGAPALAGEKLVQGAKEGTVDNGNNNSNNKNTDGAAGSNNNNNNSGGGDGGGGDNGDDDDDDAPEGITGWINFFMAWPWNKVFAWTIPNCAEEDKKKWYVVTFVMSILWISALSYVMVEVAVRMGCILQIPTVVMGLTVLAAGTSIPDALGSVAVAREGQGDMAISNAIGSNVFDMTFALGVPALLKTCIISPGSSIDVDAGALEVYVGILFGTLFLILLLFAAFRWRTKPIVGVILLSMYTCFVTYALLDAFYISKQNSGDDGPPLFGGGAVSA